ncbi:MAG: DHH family phosphoesterase [archaeon]
MRDKLIDIIRGKHVHIATHWDADGVTSGALIYHLIKPYVKDITKISKGKTFLVEPDDVKSNAEVIICTDIQPSDELRNLPSNPKIVYIDHHPSGNLDYEFVLHDPNAVSTSMLIYENLFQDSEDPYIIFLTLLGYFGDRGQGIPVSMESKARRLLGDLLEMHPSNFGKPYFEIERFVSLMNTGKRMDWCGNEPLELLTSVNRIEALFTHELFAKLNSYKRELRDAYYSEVNVASVGKIDFVFISNPKNIQGVVAARNMNVRPILVVNHYENSMIGSMRVPDALDFDAGAFLEKFNGRISSFLGGGHEKAAGFNMCDSEFGQFVELLKEFAGK